MKVDSGSILGFMGKIENAPPELRQVVDVGYLLIAVGAVLFVIGFLGCFGAIRENRCMLLAVGHWRNRLGEGLSRDEDVRRVQETFQNV